MKKHILSKIMVVFVCAAILMSTMSLAFAKTPDSRSSELKIAVVSDLHYLSPELIKDTEDYTTDLNSDRKIFTESDAILGTMLAKIRDEKPDILLVAGDLTKDGELECHKGLAEHFKALKADLPNLKIYIAPGNHDVRNANALNFNTEDGKAIPATRTEPSDFKEVYADVTYNDETVIDTFTPGEGKEAGGLSYVARPAEGYTVISIDSGRYSSDNTSNGENEHETSGQISADLEAFVKQQIKEAKDRGDVVIGLEHHGLIPHFSMEPDLLPMYLVNDYERISEEFADAGMDYIFTGHMHANDVSVLETEAGNRLVDIETGSALTYPSPMRFLTISREEENGMITENLTCETRKNLGPITFLDPLTGEVRNITDLTEYTRAHGFSKEMLSTTLKKFLPEEIQNDITDDFLDNLIADLCKLPVTDGKTLIDYVNYIYQCHLAGDDHGNHPIWVNDVTTKVDSGELLNSVLKEVLIPNLAALPERTAKTIINKLPLPVGIFGKDTGASPVTEFLNFCMVNGTDLAIKAFPGVYKTINDFISNIVDSMSNDVNFAQDNNFTLTRTYAGIIKSSASVYEETPLASIQSSLPAVYETEQAEIEAIADTGDNFTICVSAMLIACTGLAVAVKTKRYN